MIFLVQHLLRYGAHSMNELLHTVGAKNDAIQFVAFLEVTFDLRASSRDDLWDSSLNVHLWLERAPGTQVK